MKQYVKIQFLGAMHVGMMGASAQAHVELPAGQVMPGINILFREALPGQRILL